MQAADLFVFAQLCTLPWIAYRGKPHRHWTAVPRSAGIYFLFAEAIPLYIGCTSALNVRLANHNKRRDIAPEWLPHYEIRFYYACFPVPSKVYLMELEADLIRRYKPLLHPPDKHVSLAPLRHLWQQWQQQDLPIRHPNEDPKGLISPFHH
jgi:predicted GIY-YIG superfamily endonuclease